MNENEYFYKLTPQIIIDSVEREGYKTTGLCWKLNSLENRVYDLELDDRSHIVVKFYRPGRWNKDQINEEHEFLFDLQKDEIPVCAPLKFGDGASIKEIENIYYAVWRRTGGRCVDEFSNEQTANLGRLLGRLHNTGRKKETRSRPKLDALTMCIKPLEYLINSGIIHEKYENAFAGCVKTIADIFNDRVRGIPYHRIHGDCHIGNLLFGETGFFFLDFDDFFTGPAVQDFWMLLSGAGEEALGNLNILIENYKLFSDFDMSWLKLIEPLRALRFINYAGWIAKRREDPAFKDAFPHFGTEEYWKQEVKDLEEQLKTIDRTNYTAFKNKIDLNVGNDEPELTNEDIFWDMKK